MKRLQLRFLIFVFLFLVLSCKKDKNGTKSTPEPEASPPIVTTSDISWIDDTSAVGGGRVSYNKQVPILEAGLCWDTLSGPGLLNSVGRADASSGSFVSVMKGLASGKTYYVRAFATNRYGTAYGDEKVFIY